MSQAPRKRNPTHRESQHQWYVAHRELTSERRRQWRAAHPEQTREQACRWRTAHRELINARERQWCVANPEKAKARAKRSRTKALSTVTGRLTHLISTKIAQSLQFGKQRQKWETLVGYDVHQLKRHLEKQFLPGMSWENRSEWHIDHKIPVSAFNYEQPTDIDFKKCWALKNLRPLWKQDNLRKNDKLETPFQPSLILRGHSLTSKATA